MAKNYVIGIGGTGARVIEALVHCCTAGLGPDELNMFIVDPDVGNGNLEGTTSLLAHYMKCRRQIRRRQQDFAWCRTEIRIPKPAIWGVLSDRQKTLADFIALDRMKTQHSRLADFASLLFTEKERKTELTVGFRGHPSIGAVTMAAHPGEDDPWKQFWVDVKESQSPGSVRVFLVGSVFGGTGAAGVPTFGTPAGLKKHVAAAMDGDKSRILLGAALVLPYFSFSTPDAEAAANEKDKIFVTAADFPAATKAALDFYATKDLAFDRLYLLGDSLVQSVGAFSTGASTQRNTAHYIELSAALAALDFFRHDEAAPGAPAVFTAARNDRTVSWETLPLSRDSQEIKQRRREIIQRFGALATAAYAMCTYGIEMLEAKHAVLDTWYRQHFAVRRSADRQRDSIPQDARDAIKDMTGLGKRYLEWLATLSHYENVRLAAPDRIFEAPDLLFERKPGGDVLLEYRAHAQKLGTLLQNTGAKSKALGFAEFIADHLNGRTDVDRELSPSDKWVHLFHHAGREFANRNYGHAEA